MDSSNPNSKPNQIVENVEGSPMEIENVEADNSAEESEDEEDEPFLQLTASGTVNYDGVTSEYFEFDVINNVDESVSSSIAHTETDLSLEIPMVHTEIAEYLGVPIDPREAILNFAKSKPPRLNDKAKNNRRTAAILKKIVGSEQPRSVPAADIANDPFKDILLDSIGGLDSQIAWLKQCILKPLKDENLNSMWGIKPPKGVLFYGPPGTGKTLLARAFGNELSKEIGRPVKFFHRKGGDVFSKLFGESSENLRDLFNQAIIDKPSIIFFDELDGLCPSRDGADNQAHTSVITTLLGLMDNLPVGAVFVFGATNRLEAVDPAVRRPGRFDKHLEFLPPNKDGRQQILLINTRKWKTGSKPSDRYLEKLSQNTVGFTGADIENLCREAFFAAFDRHVPESNLDSTIADMKVLDEDWTKALSKIKPTNIAIYGSTFYTPRLPNKAVNPLVSNIQEEIVAKLIPLLPSRSESLNARWAEEISLKMSTFIVSDSTSLSVDIIESMILPGVLVHDRINHLPVYILSNENILSQPGGSGPELSHITKTINQALNSYKPCILYIPRLDDLAKSRNSRFISRQLRQLCGKPVLVLATLLQSSHGLSKCDNNDLQLLFGGTNRSLELRKPTTNERKNFFRPVFVTFAAMIKDENNNVSIAPEFQKTLDKLLEDAVEQTDNDPIELILVLHDTLSKAFDVKHNTNRRNLLLKLTKVIKDYAGKKLIL